MTGVDPVRAVELSLIVGAWCIVLGSPFAIGLGFLLARREFWGKSLVSALVLTPLVMPPVVTGFLLLEVLGRDSALGGVLAELGLPIPFTLAGAVAAGLAVGFPLYVSAARSAFEAIDRRFEDVSLTLGVPPWRTFLRVTLPLALPGLVGGMVLAFARALGEFGATVVVAGNAEGQTRTLALAVYTLLDVPGAEPQAWRLVALSVGLSTASLLGHEALTRWQKRRLEVSRG